MGNWHKRFMDMAKLTASWTEDLSGGVGCVIVNDSQQIISTGYNGLPRSIHPNKTKLSRPDKYKWTEHAERNAIYQAASVGVSLKGATLYSTLFPCADCARAIIQSGISRVVTYPFQGDSRYLNWGEDWETASLMLAEACVRVSLIGINIDI